MFLALWWIGIPVLVLMFAFYVASRHRYTRAKWFDFR